MENMDKWYASLIKKGRRRGWARDDDVEGVYTVMTAMKLCTPKQAPSRAIQKRSAPGRTQIWSEGETTRLVKGAWRAGCKGLACIIPIAWNTSFSPVDCRTLPPCARCIRRGRLGILDRPRQNYDDRLRDHVSKDAPPRASLHCRSRL